MLAWVVLEEDCFGGRYELEDCGNVSVSSLAFVDSTIWGSQMKATQYVYS
jgi:hypothetical protein